MGIREYVKLNVAVFVDGWLCQRRLDFQRFLFLFLFFFDYSSWSELKTCLLTGSQSLLFLSFPCKFVQSQVPFRINPWWHKMMLMRESRRGSQKLKGLAQETETIRSFHLSHVHWV